MHVALAARLGGTELAVACDDGIGTSHLVVGVVGLCDGREGRMENEE